MTIEEKAKAYDHALKIVEKYKDARIMFTKDLQEELFPELKESEDEKIRKELLEHVKYCSESIPERAAMIAWLEKQGQTFTKKDVDDAYLKGISDAKNELEKQSEQKPVEWSEADALIQKLKKKEE